ncbi:MAG: hypothetical protein IPG16_22960 [Comamonadaceae bacterium]|nr:hypothetical protein [Comamonadaceae bacterium]
MSPSSPRRRTTLQATNAAKAGQDYVALSNTEFTIKAGDTSAFVDVDVMGDALKENNEVFDLVLSTPVGAGFAKGATLTAVGTIVDDENHHRSRSQRH